MKKSIAVAAIVIGIGWFLYIMGSYLIFQMPEIRTMNVKVMMGIVYFIVSCLGIPLALLGIKGIKSLKEKKK